jgi:hypothetical protein
LTEEGPSELADELVRGEALQLDEGTPLDEDMANWEAWNPDPVDADPCKSFMKLKPLFLFLVKSVATDWVPRIRCTALYCISTMRSFSRYKYSWNINLTSHHVHGVANLPHATFTLRAVNYTTEILFICRVIVDFNLNLIFAFVSGSK